MKRETRSIIIWVLAVAVMTAGLIAASRLTADADRAVPAAAEGAVTEEAPSPAAEYEPLFDASVMHTIDIRLTDETWDAFIAACQDKEYRRCDITIDGETFTDAAIRAKGNSSMQRSRATGKYSFKVEFDHYGGESFHGLDKLGLNNLVVDDSCMRDYITYRMMYEFGVPAPLCSYAFVTVNGGDWGLYLAVEGVEDSFLARNYGGEPGALYKPDNLNNGGGGGRGGMPGMGNASDDVKLKYIDGDPDSYPNIFDSAKTDITRKDKYRLIESLRRLAMREDIPAVVDIDEMLRYLVVHTFVCNGDSYTGSSIHNYYLHEKDGRLAMIPWDYNEAFGDFGSGSMASVVNLPIDSPVTSGSLEDRPMVAWIFADPAYTDMYHELYGAFLTEFPDSGRIEALLSSAQALIGPYVERDPHSFCTYEEFVSAADELAVFFDLRAQSAAGQLDGTIPSTSEGQSLDSSALVDTSALPSSGELGGASGGMGGPSRGSSEG